MSDQNKPTWDALEQAVCIETCRTHRREMALGQELLDHLTDGLGQAASELRQALQADHEEGARNLVLLITSAACNSLKASFDVCFRGYYAQAQALTRNAFECWLAGAYVHCTPASAAQLQEKSSRWPKPAKIRYVVAKAIAQNAKQGQMFQDPFGKMYKRLSKLTHPSFDSVSSVLDDQGSLRVGPFFSRNRLLICCDDGYRTAILLHHLLGVSFPWLQGTGWSHRTDALGQKVNAWKKKAASGTEA